MYQILTRETIGYYLTYDSKFTKNGTTIITSNSITDTYKGYLFVKLNMGEIMEMQKVGKAILTLPCSNANSD